ncbi:MAG: GNAT family N-acetyltransferase [Eubacteriales bacterium]|nr:GNAT family N-acetyltransferase [Eubacteriales bacterium]
MKKEDVISVFKNPPRIETPRLILRKISPGDYKDMYEYSSSSKVTKYLLWRRHPNINYTREYAKYLMDKYSEGVFYDWAIELKENHKMIGTVGFSSFDFETDSAEIGYVLAPDYQHEGYATEAAMRVIEFGFSYLHADKIYARYMYRNHASRRVMDRCGMRPERIEKHAVKRGIHYTDVIVCSILSSEFYNKRL